MQIKAEHIAKRYGRDWIFRDLSLTLEAGKAYAVTGPNGSGKSTLLQCLAGAQPLTEGSIIYQNAEHSIPEEQHFQHVGIAAPYLELIEEFTLKEQLLFHMKFKPMVNNTSAEELAEIMMLSKSWNKEIKYFSSGMKQRVKLALALFTNNSIIILDEPTVNLDDQGTAWYLEHVQLKIKERILLIGSNQPHEYSFCNEIISLQKH